MTARPTTDRNLYVDGVTFDGTTVPGATAALISAGSQSFGFGGGGAAATQPGRTDQSGTPTTVTIDPTDASPVVNLSHVDIVATAGDHSLFIGGSFDTATLTGGAETVLAFQGHNSITTAPPTTRFASPAAAASSMPAAAPITSRTAAAATRSSS